MSIHNIFCRKIRKKKQQNIYLENQLIQSYVSKDIIYNTCSGNEEDVSLLSTYRQINAVKMCLEK